MTLKEYSRLLQPFIPVRADWVAIDEEAIRVFTKRPELIGVAERHLRWKGPCVAIIRYWKDFLDLSECKDTDGTMDWLLAVEPVDFPGWKSSEHLEDWTRLYDVVSPLEFSYATLDKGVLSLWKRTPVWQDGAWCDRGLQKPIAIFSAPSRLISTASGASTGPDGIAKL